MEYTANMAAESGAKDVADRILLDARHICNAE